MADNMVAPKAGSILLIGASRGLGLGLAGEYQARGWQVVATARNPDGANGLAKLAGDTLRIEAMDVVAPGAGADLAERLAGSVFDVIFVVAGQAKTGRGTVQEATAEDAASDFVTNAYAPPVVAEALLGRLAPGGMVVFMTSLLGSLASFRGGMEVYSATKAALNMLGIAFAKRHPDVAVVLMHPGWVKTDMGGEAAPLDVATSVRGMADVIASHAGKPGVSYVDYAGHTLPW
jgi:NAD(P)-dependent dehydrogenase (short-subunit alcohol dehydrogenase family)